MQERIMPTHYETEPSAYAGKEPEYEGRQVMRTTSGEKVMIMRYLKDEGLYVVTSVDQAGVISPPYKINPDKLVKEAGAEKE